MCYKNALLFHSEAALYSLPVPSRLLQHVPFRESKLTHYLQSFFCGRGKACMIININQCASMYDETLNVLKFSAVAKKVHTCFIVFVRGLRAALSLQVIPLFGNCANTHPPTHPEVEKYSPQAERLKIFHVAICDNLCSKRTMQSLYSSVCHCNLFILHSYLTYHVRLWHLVKFPNVLTCIKHHIFSLPFSSCVFSGCSSVLQTRSLHATEVCR